MLIGLLGQIQTAPNEPADRYEHASTDEYAKALTEIITDSNNELVLCSFENHVIAMIQLTYIQGLTLQASRRALVEGVRVHSKYRGQGIGKLLMRHALERARAKG